MTNLKILKTELDECKADAKALLLEHADKGYERVTILGFKDGQLHYQSSRTMNFMEDIGSMVLAILDRYHANTGAGRRK